MRIFLTAIVLLAGWSLAPVAKLSVPAANSIAFSQVTAVGHLPGAEQVIFSGDRTCNDLWNDCDFAAVRASHRYLHIVLHDAPANADWQVQAGPYCHDGLPNIAGGEPLDATGYLEVVVNLGPTGTALEGVSSCFIFRGRNHWAVTYFAAYLDDSASPDADALYPGYQSQYGRPAEPDLDVTYIHRSPSYAYDAAKNGPAPGDRVVFSAHVNNAGSVAAAPFVYRWLFDGKPVVTGVASAGLAAGAEITFQFPWVWQQAPHTLTFRVIPADQDLSRTNNQLSIRTDALTLGFWVERSAWDYFNRYQWLYCSTVSCSGSDSFADWLEREVSAWNGVLASAVYPGLSPNGVVDRIRVDEITVVPDGSLPLHGGRPTNSPDQSDHSVDLQWGLPTAGIAKAYPHMWDGPFNLDWSMIHELGHARSLADMYRFDVSTGPDTQITVNDAAGQPIYNPQDPTAPTNKLAAFYTVQNDKLLYQDAEHDLMDCTCDTFYSAYTALILNRIQGRRPVCGNFNPPCNLGDWFLDLPPDNRIRLVTSNGRPLADGTEVRAFYDQSTTYSGHIFTENDAGNFRVADGEIDLGADPFHTGGNRNLAGHDLLLLEVDPDGFDRFCFVEPTTFNLADWLGYRDAAHPAIFTLDVDRHAGNSCQLAPPPSLVNEPFGTSPYQSQVTMQTVTGKHADGDRSIDIHLLDSSTPALPMRDRLIHVLNSSGAVVAQGRTDSAGELRVQVSGRTAVHIVDVTDDGLAIPLAGAVRSTRAGRR